MSTKQIIVIRKDIKLSKGKAAAQCAHACLSSVIKADKKIVDDWQHHGQKKVVVGVKNLKELEDIEKKCKKAKIPCALIVDAGLTAVPTGTITSLGIGPDKSDKIDKITGKLKLL
ncbi:MAG: peptidyl-tRNA hydrolase Pth2 [Candidatus Aenigmatarchaeota archaeon]